MFYYCDYNSVSSLTCAQVIWKRLYSTRSTSEKGTMYQLKNLINRSAVPLDPQDNMKAAEDFLLFLLHTLIQAKDTIHSFLPSHLVLYLSKAIVNNYVLLPSKTKEQSNHDQVHIYAKEFLTLALVFHDAIKEMGTDY